ncbi:MAG: hypothetical protein ACU0BS_03770 [Hasllibacter sp.]
MPKDERVAIAADRWTEITGADVAALTVQAIGGGEVWLRRAGATPPQGGQGLLLRPGGATISGALDAVWPGAPGARVWARARGTADTAVWVSHA